MNHPKISVCLTTYNGERFVREQINSILKQTFTDFELIVCDDVSKDSTVSILKEMAEKDERIKIYVNEKNLGFKKNFEKCISLAIGDYIALSDQDDIWTDNHIELLLKTIGNNSIACANEELVDFDGKSMNVFTNEIDRYYNQVNNEKMLYRLMFFGNAFQGNSMLLKADFVKKYTPIPENFPYHDIWFDYCACIENGIAYTFTPIVKYRQHGNNVTFNYHNQLKRNFFQKIVSKISFLIFGIPQEILLMSDIFFDKYEIDNIDFHNVKRIISHVKKHYLTMNDIKILWDNYESITTLKTHKTFVKFIVSLLRWKMPNKS